MCVNYTGVENPSLLIPIILQLMWNHGESQADFLCEPLKVSLCLGLTPGSYSLGQQFVPSNFKLSTDGLLSSFFSLISLLIHILGVYFNKPDEGPNSWMSDSGTGMILVLFSGLTPRFEGSLFPNQG